MSRNVSADSTSGSFSKTTIRPGCSTTNSLPDPSSGEVSSTIRSSSMPGNAGSSSTGASGSSTTGSGVSTAAAGSVGAAAVGEGTATGDGAAVGEGAATGVANSTTPSPHAAGSSVHAANSTASQSRDSPVMAALLSA